MLQAYVRLSTLDDVWSGHLLAAPRLGQVAMSSDGPTQWSVIPMKSTALAKDTTLQVIMQYERRREL
jgi:hypothetical protein